MGSIQRSGKMASEIVRIFVIRESDRYEGRLLGGMLDQTLAPHRELPGVKQALELGLEPFLSPEKFDATERRGNRHRAVLYALEGSLFVLWAGSAAGDDRTRDNPFVNTLAELVRRYRPNELLASNFSRLVRSDLYSPKLKIELQEIGCKVRVREVDLDMAEATSSLIWDMMSFMTSQERDAIEMRLALGQVYKASQEGAPPIDKRNLPLGIKWQDDQLVVDDRPEVRERVYYLISVLARDCTAREKIEALDEIGLTNTVIQRYYQGDEAEVEPSRGTIGDVRGPSTVINTLGRRYELYRYGRWTFRRKIPKVSLSEFGGFPVEVETIQRKDGSSYEQHYVVMNFDIGVPEDGWAPEQLFDAWRDEIDRAEARKGTNGAGPPHQRALSGYPSWEAQGREYKLRVLYPDLYELRSRPAGTTGGWDARLRDSRPECRIRSQDLHNAVADAAIRAVTEGSPVRFAETAQGIDMGGDPDLIVLADPATRRSRLERERTTLQDQLDRAVELATNAPAEAASAYTRTIDRVSEQIRAVNDSLDALEESSEPPAPVEVTIRFEHVLRALGHLKSGARSVPRDIATNIRTVIRNLRLFAHADRVCAYFDLYLPAANQLVVLEGVEARCDVDAMGTEHVNAARKIDESNALQILREGGGIDGAHEHIGGYRNSDARYLADLLRHQFPSSSTAVRSVALFHPVMQARIAAMEYLESEAQTALPGPLWDRLVTELTAEPAFRPTSYRKRTADKQQIVDAVRCHGGPLTRTEATAFPELRLTRDGTRWYHNTFRSRSRTFKVDLLELRDDVLHARACPRCDRADLHVVLLPEHGGLLCPGCLKDIDTDQDLPAEYLGLANSNAWPKSRSESDHRAESWEVAFRRWPDHPLTLNEIADLVGCARAGLQYHLEDMLSAKRLLHVGYSPTDSGLNPKLYLPAGHPHAPK